MRAAQPTAKLYATSFDGAIRDFIDVFHRWIQTRRTDDLLIDVHDYSHVHEGPGIILIAHECIYAMDLGEGRLGLAYKRRRGDAEEASEGLADAVARAARACQLLEEDVGGLRFSASEILVGFDDRLRAPGGEATFGALRPALTGLASRLLGPEAQVDPVDEPGGPFRARLRGVATLEGLVRLEG